MIQTREYALSKSEYKALLRHLYARRLMIPLALLWALTGYLLVGDLHLFSLQALGWTLAQHQPLVIFALILTLWLLWIGPALQAGAKRARPLYLSQTAVFGAAGIELRTADGSRLTRPYHAIERIEQSGERLLLFQDTGFVFVFPRRAFDSDAELAAAAELVRGGMAASPAAGEAEAAAPASLRAGCKRNLIAALRLLTLRPLALQRFVLNGDQLFLMLVLTLGIYLIGEHLSLEGPLIFNSFGLASHLASVLLLLAGIYLVTRLLGSPALFLALAVPMASIEPWLALVYASIEGAYAGGMNESLYAPAHTLLFVWYVVAWIRAARLALPERTARVPATVGILFAASLLPLWWNPYSDFWYSTAAIDDPTEQINVEDVYYAQPDRLARALEGIANQRPGTIDLYHIGFGGYAEQGVFRREIGHVKQILDQRFDTRGRSLSLINSRESLDQVPIASRSNLRLALEGMASRMDTGEDVLLLYLTSHGSRDATLSVSFRPLQLNELDAADLRAMLDASGIRWRVIVVSACFAGSFVDTLKDEHSLVIAAAAPDRNSFGCSNDNEFTYFGEAYFKAALSETTSFTEAFERARQIVTRREAAEKHEPSLPVMAVGSRIGPHLRQLEQRLAALPAPAG